MNVQFAPIRQNVTTKRIEDVEGEVQAGLQTLSLDKKVLPGMHIAVAVGSRGISCITRVVRTIIEYLRSLKAEPFLVPAMGSHGGGTAEGQRAVLEDYGLGEDRLGVPILSSMDTIQIGETDGGMPVYFDSHAASADGIIAINRIKEHTAFKARWESGLLKILTVGLGKARGAAEIHNWGLTESIPLAARVVLEHMPIIAGIGIVENGNHEPARISVIPSNRIEIVEPDMLELARRLTPRIPFEPLDLLVVQEMGKDISGTGIDLNVVGMWRRLGGPIKPQIKVITVLDLTEGSHGNAIGVGHADLITQRLRDKIDIRATYLNSLTAHNLAGGKIPITLPTDFEAIQAGLAGISPKEARIVLIRNTLALTTLWVSEPLLYAVDSSPNLEQIGPLRDLSFDESGSLLLSW